MFLLVAEFCQHVIYLRSMLKFITYAYTKASIFLTYKLLDVSKSIMPTIGTIASQAHLAQRQSEVIDDYKEVLCRNILFLKPIANGIAREIHVCGRLEEDDFSTLYACFCHKAVAFVFKGYLLRLSEGIDNHPTYIMSCLVILHSGVSKTNYKKLFQNYK